MLFPQAVVMLEVVALVLQGVEGLVLDPPAGTAATHDFVSVLLGNHKICHPTEMLFLVAIGISLPVFEEVDTQFILAAFVEVARY